MSGVLHAIGRADGAPVPPLNLVGDFGGGGMLLAFGVACALIEAQRSGKGQVVDAAMVEGASLLSTMFWGMRAGGRWSDARGDNVLDTGAPWYDVYETLDHKLRRRRRHRTASSTRNCLQRLGLANEALPAQHDRARWPELRRRFAQVFATKTRDEWCGRFEGSDACVSPVLTFAEAERSPAQRRARAAHVTRRRRRPARAGAALFAHAGRGPQRTARTRSARRRSAGRLGIRRCRDRAPARAGRRRFRDRRSATIRGLLIQLKFRPHLSTP